MSPPSSYNNVKAFTKEFHKAMPIDSSLPLKSAIVYLLRRGPLSLAALQEKTEVSLPTLRRAVNELTSHQWIKSVGRSANTGGRPATLYGLDRGSYIILGAHLELPGIHFALTDITGEVIDHAYINGDINLGPNEFIRAISNYTQKVKMQFVSREIIGFGIATPGYVDSVSGDVLSIGRAPNWPNFPLRTRLEAELGLPVVVENDIDCMTLAEINGGEAEIEDLIYIGFIEGVKASMYLNGRLYKGPFGNAGLIGHTTVFPNGPKCSCGKKGCLETIASVRAVNERFDQRTDARKDLEDEHKRIRLMEDRTEKFQAILGAASAGDEICSEIVDSMINALAQAVANLVYLLQVGTLVIGGALSGMPPSLQNKLENEVRSRLPPLLSNHTVIRQAQITPPFAAAAGATHRFFERFITSAESTFLRSALQEDEHTLAKEHR